MVDGGTRLRMYRKQSTATNEIKKGLKSYPHMTICGLDGSSDHELLQLQH